MGAAGDGLGARGAWTQWRSAPGAAALPGGRGGGLLWLGGGVQGRRPLAGHRLLRAWGGMGGLGCAGVVQSLQPPSAPLCVSPSTAGARLKDQAVGGAVRQGGLGHPSLRRARPGLSGVLRRRARPAGLAAGRSVPAVVSARVPCAAGGLLRSLPPHAPACGRPGGGGGLGGGRSPGEYPGLLAPTLLPARHSPRSQLGAGLLFQPLPAFPGVARGAAVASCRAAGGGGGAWCWRALGPGQLPVVSGQ